MGLALADAYKVLDRFNEAENENRLKNLLNIARAPSSSRTGKNVKGRNKTKEVLINVGWYNFYKNKDMYTQVRELQSGGKRTLVVERYSKLYNLLASVQELFFPKGVSVKGKLLRDYKTKLADFSLIPIDLDTSTVEDYISKCSLKGTPKINLLTKELSSFKKLEYAVRFSNSDSDDDFISKKVKTIPAVIEISDEQFNPSQGILFTFIPYSSTSKNCFL